MAAGDYILDLTIGAWSVTLNKGDLVAPGEDAYALDPLKVQWSMTGYPAQPTAELVSFRLYVPDRLVGPEPKQGLRVEVAIRTPFPGNGGNVAHVLDFVGLITDVDGTPLKDGLVYSIVAADYRSSPKEERIGNEDWPAESRAERIERMFAASAQPYVVPTAESDAIAWAGIGPDVAARDADPQPTNQLIEETLAAAVAWWSLSPAFWITGYIDGTFRAPKATAWVRAIVAQSVDGTGEVTFPLAFLPGGGPDHDAALPYTVALTAGELTLVRKNLQPFYDTRVAWIPSSAVVRDTVAWRQDKATNINRARVTAPDIVTIGLEHTSSLTAEFPDLSEPVTGYGPNEVTVALDAAQTDYIQTTDLLYVLLGRYYDASPRWALDTFTILAEQIPNGDNWPRLFNPRQHTQMFDQAAGKLVLITDVDARWNLHDRADYWGRLVGATLELAAGKLRWTATLAHRLPWGTGIEDPVAAQLGPVPTHHPITYAELTAGANPDYNQCGELTYADLQLVEG